MTNDYTETPEWKALCGAAHHLQNASHYGSMALAIFDERKTKSAYYQFMRDELSKAAADLGYDLVKREKDAA